MTTEKTTEKKPRKARDPNKPGFHVDLGVKLQKMLDFLNRQLGGKVNRLSYTPEGEDQDYGVLASSNLQNAANSLGQSIACLMNIPGNVKPVSAAAVPPHVYNVDDKVMITSPDFGDEVRKQPATIIALPVEGDKKSRFKVRAYDVEAQEHVTLRPLAKHIRPVLT